MSQQKNQKRPRCDFACLPQGLCHRSTQAAGRPCVGDGKTQRAHRGAGRLAPQEARQQVVNSDHLFQAGFVEKRSRGGGRRGRGSASHRRGRKRSRRRCEDGQGGPEPRRTRTATRHAVVPCTGAGRHGRPTLWLLISWPCSKALSSVHPQKGIVGQQTEARRQVQSAVKGQGQPDGGTDRMEARGLSHMQVSVCTDS